MTRILHISNTDIGTDSRIRKELAALTQLADCQVSVIGVPTDNVKGDGVVDAARYRKLGLASRRLSVLPRALRYCIELIEFTSKAVFAGRRIRPEIVHCHDAFAMPSGWILKRMLSCRLVYDAHELESKKNGQNIVLSCATLLIEKLCWKQVDLLVSVSESIISWYARHLGVKPNVLVLNSPIVIKSRNCESSSGVRGTYFHETYGIPQHHVVFVYVGIFGPGRGIEMCLDAFADGPEESHIVFIGYGRLTQVIAEYAKRHSNIHIHQAVPHERVVSIVSSADYGLCLIENVSLSDYLCLPNKLFEYMFARVPVLASDFPEIRRVVHQYSLGDCCAPTVDSVRSALARLRVRRAGRPSSDLTALSWETQAARLRAAYQQVLLADDRVPIAGGAGAS